MRGRIARLRAAVWVLTASGLLAGGRAPAQTPATPVVQAQWKKHSDQVHVAISLFDLMTTKQKSMINGGFTTVSRLAVWFPPADGGEQTIESRPDRAPDRTVRCSIKYDAWLETYDAIRLRKSAEPVEVESAKQLAEVCFSLNVDDPQLLERWEPDGGDLYAVLGIKQTSREEAEKIKEWLVQQQSGMMQSLFSHMMGELSLNQTVAGRVSVPPRPESLSPVVKEDDDKA